MSVGIAVRRDRRSGQPSTSTNPTGGASAWQIVSVDAGKPLTGVACASASLCVVADQVGNVISSTNPTGAHRAWAAPAPVASDDECSIRRTCVRGLVPGAYPQANPTLACPSSSLCVMVDQFGVVMTSTDPASAAAARTPFKADPSRAVSSWQQAAVDGASAIQSLSCTSGSLCIGLDDGAHVLSSRNAASGKGTWKKTHLASLDEEVSTSLSCTAGPLCAIFSTQYGCGVYCYSSGQVISSTNPTGPVSAWTAVGIGDPFGDSGSHLLVAGSCPSRSLCVTLDSSGNILTSTNPTGPASVWHTTAIGLGMPSDISCPTTTFCAAVATGLDIATSAKPTGGPGSWHLRSLSQGSAPSSPPTISCPTSALCAIVSGKTVLTSTDPASKRAGKRVTVNVPTPLMRISCPSAAMCVAIDQSGDVVTSTNPTGGAADWTRTTIDPGNALTSLSCPPGACIAGDNAGNILVGTSQGVGRKTAVAALNNVVHSCSLQRSITVLQRGGCPGRMTSPGLGLVTVTWLDSHGTTIALGTANTPASGSLPVHVELTSAGKRELGNAFHEFPVHVVASFQDLPGHVYSRSDSITLLP